MNEVKVMYETCNVMMVCNAAYKLDKTQNGPHVSSIHKVHTKPSYTEKFRTLGVYSTSSLLD